MTAPPPLPRLRPAQPASAPKGLAKAAACRFCGKPLSPLQQRLGALCDSAACRWRAGEATLLAMRQAAVEAWRAAAPPALRERVRQAPVVWLREYEVSLADVTDAEREAHAAFVEAVAADPAGHPRDPNLEFDDDTQPMQAADAPLCSRCLGRCCQAGVARRGFLDGPLLERQARQLGGTLADAAAFYQAHVPARHVAASCLYHGAAGCTLPREARAPVCNGWACDSLLEARRAVPGASAGAAPGSGRGALIAVHVNDRVPRAAWLPPDAGPAVEWPLTGKVDG